MKRPTNGKILQEFGDNPGTYPGGARYSSHPGQDYAAQKGDAALNALTGRVIEVVYGDPQYTGVVKVLTWRGNEKIICIYGNLSEPLVELNQEVVEGQKLGYIGLPINPRDPQEPHLHFEVRLNDGHPKDAVDPNLLFNDAVKFSSGTYEALEPLNVRTMPGGGDVMGVMPQGTTFAVDGDPVRTGDVVYVPVVMWVAAQIEGRDTAKRL